MVSATRILCVGLLAGSAVAAPTPSIGSKIKGAIHSAKGAVESVVDGTKKVVGKVVSDLGDEVDKIKSSLFPSAVSGSKCIFPRALQEKVGVNWYLALDPALLPWVMYHAEYSAASYCSALNAPGQQVTCRDNICPTVTNSDSTIMIAFANKGKADTTGFVALDDTAKEIVVAFRGSSSIRNWIADFNAGFTDAPYCNDCLVHEGFYGAYQDQADSIRSTVDKLSKANPTYGITVTGHSLGGALAQVAAGDFRSKGFKNVTACTFGSPRIGNKEFSDWVSKSGPNYRFTHTDDPVPRLPLILMGYEHVSPEYHITKGDSNIPPSNIDILEGGINFGGNTAQNGIVSADFGAHLHYLLGPAISSCGDNELEFR